MLTDTLNPRTGCSSKFLMLAIKQDADCAADAGPRIALTAGTDRFLRVSLLDFSDGFKHPLKSKQILQ
jgi:hypothetical protein